MEFSDFLKKADSLLTKKQENQEKTEDFQHSKSKFDAIEYEQSGLDESIRSQLEQMEQGYEDDFGIIEQERRMIEEERRETVTAVQKELSYLKQANEKLEATQNSKYANHFLDAKRACENRINEYTLLLERLEAGANDSSKSNAEHFSNLEEDLSALSEIRTKADAVRMLTAITPSQRQAVTAYTSEYGPVTYKQMNGFLRDRRSPNEGSRETRAAIKELHNLLEHQVTKRPITVYRTVSADVEMVNGPVKSINQYRDEELVGKLLFDRGFVSTSLDLFSTRPGSTKLIIDLPAGTQGAYIGDISAFKEQENEFLMDFEQHFRVTKVERKDGMRFIYVKSLKRKNEVPATTGNR